MVQNCLSNKACATDRVEPEQLSILLNKLPCEMSSVKVCSRFSFILDDWTTYGWSQAPPDLDMFSEVYGPEDMSQLPFGPTKV